MCEQTWVTTPQSLTQNREAYNRHPTVNEFGRVSRFGLALRRGSAVGVGGDGSKIAVKPVCVSSRILANSTVVEDVGD